MDLKSKIAIVTGASRGLGKAISEALLAQNANVYGIARSWKNIDLQKGASEGEFFQVNLDITDEAAVKSWMKSTFSETHTPQILINNAGSGLFGKIDALPSEAWHQMINTNLNALYYMTAAVVPLMKYQESSSHIINIGSILGKVSGSEKSAYSATKFGLQGFSEALFKELRGFNIKVSCVNPGSIETSFFESSGIEPNEKMLQHKELADVLIYLLKTPDNLLIDELTVRPLNPKRQ